MTKITKPELIAPAGDMEKLKIAFMYGADAVYASTPDFSMRTREIGFNQKTLKEAIDYAHSIGKKVYLTLNVFPHANEIEKIKKHAQKTVKLNPDAIIVADPGVLSYLKSITNIPIHLSTQANTTNQLAAEFWRKAGAERIVLARELSLKDITIMSKYCSSKLNKQKNVNLGISDSENSPSISNVDLEAFVHGAMCMAYSGRCQISNYFTGRDPNKGACVQACRFKYKIYELEEEMRKGEKFQIYEDDRGSYVLNSRDLCMIEYIPDLIKSGISSFKIEGRLKSIYYVGIVTRAYRKAIDLYFDNPKLYEKEKKNLLNELKKTSSRAFTTGFYFDKPDQNTNNYATSRAASEWGFVGLVKDYDKVNKTVLIEAKNYFPKSSKVEIVTPDQIVKTTFKSMVYKGTEIDVVHAGYIFEAPLKDFVPNDSFVRIKS